MVQEKGWSSQKNSKKTPPPPPLVAWRNPNVWIVIEARRENHFFFRHLFGLKQNIFFLFHVEFRLLTVPVKCYMMGLHKHTHTHPGSLSLTHTVKVMQIQAMPSSINLSFTQIFSTLFTTFSWSWNSFFSLLIPPFFNHRCSKMLELTTSNSIWRLTFFVENSNTLTHLGKANKIRCRPYPQDLYRSIEIAASKKKNLLFYIL